LSSKKKYTGNNNQLTIDYTKSYEKKAMVINLVDYKRKKIIEQALNTKSF